jgi:hypothetical protein
MTQLRFISPRLLLIFVVNLIVGFSEVCGFQLRRLSTSMMLSVALVM